jgi:plastocyanin
MHRSRPFPALALAGMLSLALAACGGGDASPSAEASDALPSVSEPTSEAPSAEPSASAEASGAGSESATVRLEDFAFDTDELTIAAGTRVTWTNADSGPHTVTEGVDGVAAADPIIDAEVAAGQSTSFTFDEPGTYQITCLLHNTMNMTVVVEG